MPLITAPLAFVVSKSHRPGFLCWRSWLFCSRLPKECTHKLARVFFWQQPLAGRYFKVAACLSLCYLVCSRRLGRSLNRLFRVLNSPWRLLTVAPYFPSASRSLLPFLLSRLPAPPSPSSLFVSLSYRAAASSPTLHGMDAALRSRGCYSDARRNSEEGRSRRELERGRRERRKCSKTCVCASSEDNGKRCTHLPVIRVCEWEGKDETAVEDAKQKGVVPCA